MAIAGPGFTSICTTGDVSAGRERKREFRDLPAETGGPVVGQAGVELDEPPDVGAELGGTGAKFAGRGAALAVEAEELSIDPAIAEDPDPP